MADDDFNSRMNEFLNDVLPTKLEQAMTKSCLLVEGKAKENCPVDDGTLRQSITHEVENEDSSIVGYVGTNVEYAPYVHQGTGLYAKEGNGRKEVPWKYQDVKGQWHSTKGQKPNPFLERAIDQSKDDIKKQFEDLI